MIKQGSPGDQQIIFDANQPQAVQDVAKKSNLTNSQFLLWLGQKLNPDIPLYNMIQTFEIAGPVNPEVFQEAFSRLVTESDTLRTVIREEDAVPRRVVLANITHPLEYLNFSGQPDSDVRYQSWLDDRRKRLLNLDKCLFDSALIKLGESRYIWYLNQHHLITDGWSFALVYRAVASRYAALMGSSESAPRQLPPYEDYVQYENQYRLTEQYAQANAYWQKHQELPADALTFYQDARASKSAQTERIVCELGIERSNRMRALASQKGFQSINIDLSLYNLFATAFSAFLHRISEVERLALGVPSHNRSTPAHKETIGVFIEICPVRIEIDPADSFTSLYQKVAREMFSALRYSQPGISSADRNTSYEVLLNFVNVTFPDFCGIPVHVDWVHPGFGDRNHSLRLQIHDFNGTGSYQLLFDFNAGLFDETQRRSTIDQFIYVLDAFLDDPTRQINRVGLASPEEVQAYVYDYNRSEVPYPINQTVVQLFERQVESSPGAVAAEFGSAEMSYAELNRRANQLAYRLRRMGASPDQLIGICMEHSLEMLVGLLGILKSGAAYVPLDPAYPKERLAFMLEDIRQGTGSAKPLLLTQPWLVDQLPQSGQQTILLDETWQTIEGEEETNLPAAAGAQNLAYVIYTSGSTGRPKGAMIEHRALLNYLLWAKDSYFQGEKLDFALFSSLSFDLTVTSIYVPLISGSRTIIYRDDPAARGMVIFKVMEDNRADIVKLTPAHLSMILNMDLSQSRVRKFIVGGSDFKTHLARRVFLAFGRPVELYNEYGPTETVVGCMIHLFDPQRDLGLSVPIGVPAANAQIYILDKYLNPVPCEAAGEMFVGGAGVGRGYLNREELTREKFLTNPFRPGERMYRTGDLAKWNASGEMVFLGRADDQVKIGGARIELGEVEQRLREFPGIEETVMDLILEDRKPNQEDAFYCVRCGLASNFPGITYDEEGVCSQCRSYDRIKERARQYFKPMDELRALLQAAKNRRKGDYDCLALVSGGKDSTYMLAQLAGMGIKVLAFTLDNGYIAAQAKANIQKVAAHLGVDHIFQTTPTMNAIFADSLRHYSNVCNGCFKTLYTLAVQLAREKGIPYIVTGLSRGQFFETRLIEDVFREGALDNESIDRAILEARKVYHRSKDLISRALDVDAFRDDAVFDQIQFVDFYRYCDVELSELYAYLDKHLSWVRPADTGRSTNCLINDVGIYIHKKQLGFHNYALPYSWDVRMGHKTRAAALDELKDEIDETQVKNILAEIGYREPESVEPADQRLVAYYVSQNPLSSEELRSHLLKTLPDYMVPAFFVHLKTLPLTPNGKLDRKALPKPGHDRPQIGVAFVAPRTALEVQVAEIWCEVLHLDSVGVNDDFFALGGKSLSALQVISRIVQNFQVKLPIPRFFESPTVASLSQVIEALVIAEIEELSDHEAGQQLKMDYL